MTTYACKAALLDGLAVRSWTVYPISRDGDGFRYGYAMGTYKRLEAAREAARKVESELDRKWYCGVDVIENSTTVVERILREEEA